MFRDLYFENLFWNVWVYLRFLLLPLILRTVVAVITSAEVTAGVDSDVRFNIYSDLTECHADRLA